MGVSVGIKRRFRSLFGGKNGRPGDQASATASWEAVVDVIFQATLARRPDPDGLTTYTAAMRSGAMLPMSVLAAVKNSHEGHMARTLDCTSLIVPALYDALLGRTSTQDEVNHWRKRAAASGGIGEIVRDILAMPAASRAQLNNVIASQGMQALFLAEYRRTGVIND